MLTKLTICNFKLFDKVEIELGDRVVFVGPNNAGKTTALQALALWEIGVKRWIEKRGAGSVSMKRPGVTINRRDLINVPVSTANLLWRDLHVRQGRRENGKSGVENVLIEIIAEGIAEGKTWECGLEFDYANEESFYCRPLKLESGKRMEVPNEAKDVHIAFLPPMSGLATSERRLDRGAINVLLGEGRTAEVLRNLCHQVVQSNDQKVNWNTLTERIKRLFGDELQEPQYVVERGEIVMSYRDRRGNILDISACGRGQQQTLLLLAHMTANPGSILLLDEPDAHLEILRQRQIYQILSDVASETASQIIAASHSEILLNEAADRDIVIAFIGSPHRINDRGSQLRKALKEIGFEQYYQAEEKGWVLYLEGSTDLAILRAFAKLLEHKAEEYLERPFVHYVANQPRVAQEHFHGLREAKPDLVGIAIYDRLDTSPPSDSYLYQRTWTKRELENYLCQKETLLQFAEQEGIKQHGPLFGPSWKRAMEESIEEIEKALITLNKPSPWSPEIKASDDFLDSLFKKFYEKVGLPNLMSKSDYYTLAPYVPKT
jgi:energy-coupling factor transporter ATP-binding protein EcfA2